MTRETPGGLRLLAAVVAGLVAIAAVSAHIATAQAEPTPPKPTDLAQAEPVAKPSRSKAPNAGRGERGWLPIISPYLHTGWGIYQARACPCVDRSLWTNDVGLSLQWQRFFALEAEYRYGALLLGGNFPFDGVALGWRGAILPDSSRWWSDLYLRAGVQTRNVMGARETSYLGLYLHPGWAFSLTSFLKLDAEMALAYQFGDMAHNYLGANLGVRFVF